MTKAAPKTPKEKIRDNKVRFAHSIVKSVNAKENKSSPNLNLEKFDISRINNKEYLDEYIEKLENEYNRCASVIQDKTNSDIRSINAFYNTEMVKIPKAVKDMPLGKYNDIYNKDFMGDAKDAVSESHSSSLDFAEKSSQFQTPLRCITNNGSTTAMKTAKRNQRI